VIEEKKVTADAAESDKDDSQKDEEDDTMPLNVIYCASK